MVRTGAVYPEEAGPPPMVALRCAATLLAVLLAAPGCAAPTAGPPARAGCIDRFDPDTDYFPDKSVVRDAVNFTIDYRRSYAVLTVPQPYPGAAPASYLLVRCGAPDPRPAGALAEAPRITVPVTRLFSASTTQLGMLAELDRRDVVAGVADPGAVVDPGLRARIAAGAVAGYAPGGQVNVETVLGAAPDVLVSGGLDDPSYAKLTAAGVPVLADAEWLEPTPLGRAEWVKVLAALTGAEAAAAAVYESVRADYRATAAAVAPAAAQPVLPGTMYQGSWSMPAGGSYAAALLRDAGGSYPWAHTPGTGSLPVSFEAVYAAAGSAPLWLVGTGWATLTDAVAADARYATLSALRDGQVWSTAGTGPGSDYWERGTARPDLLLADLVAILHPRLAPGHRFEFYRRVPA